MMQPLLDHLAEFAGIYAIRLVTAVLIIVTAIVLGSLVSRAAQRALQSRDQGALGPLARGFTKASILVIGVVMALDQTGLNVGALLAGAGILGLAVGFGAQSLVKDIISGFFLLLNDVLRPGDIAKVGEATGVVEEVGLRQSSIRSFNGQLWYVPNGEIGVVGNFSRGWCRAVVEVSLAYEQDVSQGLRVLQEVGDEVARELGELVLEPPQAQGVLGLDDSCVTVRLIMKVKAAEHWGIERTLRQRIKAAFDASGVEIPFPRHVVYHRREDQTDRGVASVIDSKDPDQICVAK